MNSKKVALYFGSFNPIHNGHLAIANYILEYSDLSQIWFVVSPHNPFKQKASLLPDYQRLELINLSLGDSDCYRASNIEFNLPQPSRTVDTLAYLYDKYPENEFALIMGADNLVNFHKWKNYQQIINNHLIYVYPRPNTNGSRFDTHKNIIFVDAPLMEISSSFIRNSIKQKKDVRFFMHPKAWEYIEEMNFYR